MISHYLQGRRNNYNLIRMICALFIAYYHCYFMIFGDGFSEAAHPYLYYSSQVALNIFFIISGFLIYQSYERRDDLFSYFSARCLRILPGVFVVASITALIFGALSTSMNLSSYYSDGSIWRYIGLTSLLDPDQTIADVFRKNINAGEINAALWTLRYEFVCYIALAIAGVLGLLRTRKSVGVITLLALIVFIAITSLTNLRDIAAINHLLHFGMSFLAGMFLYKYADHIALKAWIALALILVAVVVGYFVSMKAAELFIIAATAYGAIYLAYIPQRLVRSYRALGDYSYGVYIYHFPIEQLTVQFIKPENVYTLYLIILPLTLAAAVLSWYMVEKPMLRKRDWLTNRLHSFKWSRFKPAA